MSSSSMHVAKTGLNAQQTRMQVIANNLSNVNTSGFKRDRANFESLLNKKKEQAASKPLLILILHLHSQLELV